MGRVNNHFYPSMVISTPQDLGLRRFTTLIEDLGLEIQSLTWLSRRVSGSTNSKHDNGGEYGFCEVFSRKLNHPILVWYVSRGNDEWARIVEKV